MTTSLCIIVAFPYDFEGLKKSPPSSIVDLCGGIGKVFCFYDGMKSSGLNSTDMSGGGAKLIGASTFGRIYNAKNASVVCSVEHSKKCSNHCCNRLDHCFRGTCPKVNNGNKKAKDSNKKKGIKNYTNTQ